MAIADLTNTWVIAASFYRQGMAQGKAKYALVSFVVVVYALVYELKLPCSVGTW